MLAKSILPEALTPKILGCVGTVDNFNAATQKGVYHDLLKKAEECLEDLDTNSAERKMYEKEEAERLDEEERAWLRSRVCGSWSGFISFLYLQDKSFEDRFECLLMVMDAIEECEKHRKDTKEMLKRSYIRIHEALAKKQDEEDEKAEAMLPPSVDPPTRLQDWLDDESTSGIEAHDTDSVKVERAGDEVEEDDADRNVGNVPPPSNFNCYNPEPIGQIRDQGSAAADASSSQHASLNAPRLKTIPRGLRKRKRDALSEPLGDGSEDDKRFLMWMRSPGRWEDYRTLNFANAPDPPPLPPPTAAALAEMAFRPDLTHPELFVDLKYPYYCRPDSDAQV